MPRTSQRAVFELIGKPVVDRVLEGYNGTIFAYGQTGTGKTYTMVGLEGDFCTDESDAEEREGIIPRSLAYAFTRAQGESTPPAKERTSTQTAINYEISMSFVQIYMEMIQDLLEPGNTNIKIREDPACGVFVTGVSWVPAGSMEQCMNIFKIGEKNRAVAFTALNAHSSRSHAVLMIRVEKTVSSIISKEDAESLNPVEGAFEGVHRHTATSSSTLYLVDLAGSERVKKTRATADRLDEAKKINYSLSALGNCIHALTDAKARHIPYRDSKLTRLLQDSLGGSAKTSMVVTIGPAMQHVDETLSSLKFGRRAMRVQNNPRLSKKIDYKGLCIELQGKLYEKSAKLAHAEQKAKEMQSMLDQLSDKAGPLGNLSDGRGVLKERRNLEVTERENCKVPTPWPLVDKKQKLEIEDLRKTHVEVLQKKEAEHKEFLLEVDKLMAEQEAVIAKQKQDLSRATAETEDAKRALAHVRDEKAKATDAGSKELQQLQAKLKDALQTVQASEKERQHLLVQIADCNKDCHKQKMQLNDALETLQKKEEELSALSSEMQRLKDENFALHQKVTASRIEHEKELTGLKQQRQDSESRAYHDYEAKVESLQKAHETAKAESLRELEAARHETAAVKQQLVELQKLFETREKEATKQLTAERAESSNRLKEEREKRSVLKQEHDCKIAQFERQVALLNEESLGLKDQAAKHKGRVSELEAQVTVLNRDSCELRGRESQLKKEIATFKEQAAEHKREIATLQGQVAEYKGRMVDLSSAIETLTDQVADYKEQVAVLQKDTVQMRQDAVAAVTYQEQMTKEVEATKLQVVKLEEALEKVTAERNMIRAEFTEQSHSYATLHTQWNTHHESLKKSEETERRMKSELAESRQALSTALQQKQTQLENARARIAELQAEVRQLNGFIAEKQQQFEDAMTQKLAEESGMRKGHLDELATLRSEHQTALAVLEDKLRYEKEVYEGIVEDVMLKYDELRAYVNTLNQSLQNQHEDEATLIVQLADTQSRLQTVQALHKEAEAGLSKQHKVIKQLKEQLYSHSEATATYCMIGIRERVCNDQLQKTNRQLRASVQVLHKQSLATLTEQMKALELTAWTNHLHSTLLKQGDVSQASHFADLLNKSCNAAVFHALPYTPSQSVEEEVRDVVDNILILVEMEDKLQTKYKKLQTPCARSTIAFRPFGDGPSTYATEPGPERDHSLGRFTMKSIFDVQRVRPVSTVVDPMTRCVNISGLLTKLLSSKEPSSSHPARTKKGRMADTIEHVAELIEQSDNFLRTRSPNQRLCVLVKQFVRPLYNWIICAAVGTLQLHEREYLGFSICYRLRSEKELRRRDGLLATLIAVIAQKERERARLKQRLQTKEQRMKYVQQAYHDHRLEEANKAAFQEAAITIQKRWRKHKHRQEQLRTAAVLLNYSLSVETERRSQSQAAVAQPPGAIPIPNWRFHRPTNHGTSRGIVRFFGAPICICPTLSLPNDVT